MMCLKNYLLNFILTNKVVIKSCFNNNKARQSNNISELLDLAREIEMNIDESVDMIPILENINIQQEINEWRKSLVGNGIISTKKRKIKINLFVSVLQKELEKNI